MVNQIESSFGVSVAQERKVGPGRSCVGLFSLPHFADLDGIRPRTRQDPFRGLCD